MTDQGTPSDQGLPSAGAGWTVEPSQVRAFADAVRQVRADLTALTRQVNQLTEPSYRPLLGTSPVGQQLTDKFVDRLSGQDGLLPQLNTALTNLDQFIETAEQAAARYTETDNAAADSMRTN